MEKETPREALERVLRSLGGEPLVVLISGHPDPDAIGSALAHQRICDFVGVPATIAHVLPVSHRENRAMVKLLNVEMMQITSGTDLAHFQFLSLVDTSAPDASVDLPPHLKLVTVVDHHRANKVDAPFVDIRLAMGATSSIYAEYMQQGLAPLDYERRADARIATALLFGIQTDTDDFTLASPNDFLAAAYVRQFCDAESLKRLGHRNVSAAVMSCLNNALSDLLVVRDFALAGVGPVDIGDRDAIGAAADYILKREDIDTAIVYGIVGDHIDGSLRTTSPSVDPATFLQTAFGRDRDGRAYGGGRADKGGFQIPLGVLGETENVALLWALVRETVESRIARAVPDIVHTRERMKARESGDA